jgi:hypothetical protein
MYSSATRHLLFTTCHRSPATCHLPFSICRLLLAICHLPSANCYLLFAICCPPFAICHLPFPFPIHYLPFAAWPLAICHYATCHLPFAIHCAPLGHVPLVIRYISSHVCCNCHYFPSPSPPISNSWWSHFSSGDRRMPAMIPEPHPIDIKHAPAPHSGQSPPEGTVTLAPRICPSSHLSLAQTNTIRRAPTTPDATRPSFFSLAQAHMGESAPSVSVATNMPLQSASKPGSGMGQLALHEKTSRGSLLLVNDRGMETHGGTGYGYLWVWVRVPLS